MWTTLSGKVSAIFFVIKLLLFFFAYIQHCKCTCTNLSSCLSKSQSSFCGTFCCFYSAGCIVWNKTISLQLWRSYRHWFRIGHCRVHIYYFLHILSWTICWEWQRNARITTWDQTIYTIYYIVWLVTCPKNPSCTKWMARWPHWQNRPVGEQRRLMGLWWPSVDDNATRCDSMCTLCLPFSCERVFGWLGASR